MRRHASPEQIIHRAVVQHLRQRGAPGLVYFHVPNGGKRRPIEAAIFKSLGVRAGVSDLILLHGGNFFALELKAAGNKMTDQQREFQDSVNDAGGYTACCDDLDRALACLKAWGLLRGSVRA